MLPQDKPPNSAGKLKLKVHLNEFIIERLVYFRIFTQTKMLQVFDYFLKHTFT